MPSIVIDTDAGSDDAVALMMALRSPQVEVEAITVVAGNVPLEQGVQNALYTVELCGASVPVYAGLTKPLLRELETAQYVHGQDGMGDLDLPLHGRSPAPGHAVDLLVDRLSHSERDCTLVCLGPLSNLAVALLRAPELARTARRCVIMGGTGELPGNVTPLAEYNIWTDPEAAWIVFRSGLPITMVGWDLSRRVATIPAALAAELRALDTPWARFAMDIQRQVTVFARETTKLDGFDLPDPLAMAVALEPSLASTVRRHVEVLLHGAARGQTAIDHLESTGNQANVDLVTAVPREKFLQRLRQALA